MADTESRNSIFLVAVPSLLLVGLMAAMIGAYQWLAEPIPEPVAPTKLAFELPSSIASAEAELDWTSPLPGDDIYLASCRPDQRLRLNQLTLLNLVNCKNPLHLHHRNLRIDFVVKPVAGTDRLADAIVTVERHGQRPETIVARTFQPYGLNLTVGRLDRTGARYVTVRSFSGGIGCCITDYVAVPEGRDRGSVAFPAVEDEAVSRTAGLHTDLDGDGRADFTFRDQRFLRQFSSGGGTVFAPLRVWNIRRGRLVEVSDGPRYRSTYRHELIGQRRNCLELGRGRVTLACPTYAATAARSGMFRSAWRDVLGLYQRRRGSSALAADVPHLVRFLRANGYLRG